MSVATTADVPPSEGGVRIRNITKTFQGTVALRNVDLDLRPGEVHALLGANGSGKSTLVKILSGYQAPDAGGEVTVDGVPLALRSPRASFMAGCRFVHQNLALVENMSVADNIMLTGGWPTRLGAIRSHHVASEIDEALSRLGASISSDALVASLTPAERTIVAVTRAIRRDDSDGARISALVLDEPTATLPQHQVAELAQVIRDVASTENAAVMMISHHLQEALDLADTVTVLRHGVKVLSAPAAALTKNAVISAMMGEEYDENALKVELAEQTSDETVLRCEHLGGTTFTDVSLVVRKGEVVGVAGLQGSGRDELLPVIFGCHPRMEGVAFIGDAELRSTQIREAMAAGLAYLPADRAAAGAIAELTARENITIADLPSVSRRGRIDRARERREAEDWFGRVSVRPAGATERALANFSGGNQQKIMLARWMRRKPMVFLLDEPTQGVDVSAQAKLHVALLEAAKVGAGVLVSSSDGEELAAICHRVLVMRRGRLAEELSGSQLTAAAIASSTARVPETVMA